MQFSKPALLLLLLPLTALAAPVPNPAFENVELDNTLTERAVAIPVKPLAAAFSSFLQAFGLAPKDPKHKPKQTNAKAPDVVIPMSSGMRFGSGPGK